MSISKTEQFPVHRNDDILLDTMMIIHLLRVKEGKEYEDPLLPWKHNLEISKNVVQTIKKRLQEYDSKLILLDRVEEETITVMERETDKICDTEYVKNTLLEMGDFKKIFYEDSKELIRDASFIYDTQPYVCPNGGTLSDVDCLLLKIHVDQHLLTKPASLLTEDVCLQNAAFSEGRETNGIEDVGVTFSQKKKWDEVERFKTIEKRTAERLENERLENERLENERLENERLENERLENERLENERLENERLENERLEKFRIKYYFCSMCRIGYSESKECPKCGK